ncbi:MAG TPA: trypsin-like peptidase domain-containing protein [Candidatus Limnocylindria bacterium]|nr:trypsin-like peptidase domain-containing protein [Candidatus Limnocylindria bacterium]
MSDPTTPRPAPDRPTEPVEVQRYGPEPQARPAAWQSAPAWSTRPPAQPTSPARVERRAPGLLPVAAVALVVGLVSGGLSAAAVSNLMQRDDAPVATQSDGPGDATTAVNLNESSAVITATDAVMPAVVTIATSTQGLFGQTTEGVGSGFIVDADGWILTNKHVVEGADQLKVQLNDTRVFDGTVIGTDPLTDLAVVRIDATDLPVAQLGSSADLERGQLAIAMGSPLGTSYQNTVTTGVVSGLGRQITAGNASQTSSETLNNLIQTDAAINPGNSGGPLVNSAGQVIGVNTAVATNAQGIGFAIPIDIAKPIVAQALDGVSPFVRPWIGVYYVPVTKQLATEEGLDVEYGVWISAPANGRPAVFPGSPAEAAGLAEGDIIVEVNGERIDADHDLAAAILPHMPGDEVRLRVLNGSSTREVTITLGTLPTD